MGKDAMRHMRLAARRRLVPVDMQQQRHDLVEIGFGNADLPPPVDDAGRHMHQDIERDRFLPLGRAEESRQQRGKLVARPP